MSISIRRNVLLSRLKAIVSLQRFNISLDKIGHQLQSSADITTDSAPKPGEVPFSKWRKLDSRTLGITTSMISEPSWIVLKILQTRGFEAYLVGGCVRDLILSKIPKDFDVITTATLQMIQGLFHNAKIVGGRFPICMVRVKGSVIEVSSFETEAKHSEANEKFIASQSPRHCNNLDVLRWRNSMQRDFTINSLFFNPFENKIYDYANGMADLRSLKLRTLMPADQSLKEDCVNEYFKTEVVISKKIKGDVSEIFDFLNNVESHTKRIPSLEIDYKLLAKGNVCETRFVLAMIILNTIGCGSSVERHDIFKWKNDTSMLGHQDISFPPHSLAKVDKKRNIHSSNLELKQEIMKKQKPIFKYNNLFGQDFDEKKKVEDVQNSENKCSAKKFGQKVAENLSKEDNNKLPNSDARKFGELSKKHKQDKKTDKGSHQSLSSLFN